MLSNFDADVDGEDAVLASVPPAQGAPDHTVGASGAAAEAPFVDGTHPVVGPYTLVGSGVTGWDDDEIPPLLAAAAGGRRRGGGAPPSGGGGGSGGEGGGRGRGRPLTGRERPAADPTKGPTKGADDAPLFAEKELRTIEAENPDGLSAVQIVDLFSRRGVRFSEATFRKYVQQGLLPRSRRVGRKGKHQGSLGLYPATTVRRINVIKQRMAQNQTIEEIQRQLFRYRDEIEALERGAKLVLSGFEREISEAQFDTDTRKSLRRDVGDARKVADELVHKLESIERRVTAARERPPGTRPPEGAEDLL